MTRAISQMTCTLRVGMYLGHSIRLKIQETESSLLLNTRTSGRNLFFFSFLFLNFNCLFLLSSQSIKYAKWIVFPISEDIFLQFKIVHYHLWLHAAYRLFFFPPRQLHTMRDGSSSHQLPNSDLVFAAMRHPVRNYFISTGKGWHIAVGGILPFTLPSLVTCKSKSYPVKNYFLFVVYVKLMRNTHATH